MRWLKRLRQWLDPYHQAREDIQASQRSLAAIIRALEDRKRIAEYDKIHGRS